MADVPRGLMPLFTSPDGRIVFAMVTPGDGDGNSAVYVDGVPVWDWFSWLAAHGQAPPRDPPPAVRPDVPGGVPSVPSPAAGGGRVIPVTDANDGPFAPRMMSDRANALVRGGTAYVFAGSLRTGGPQFFAVELASEQVTRLGTLPPYVGETEGWYWLGARVVLPHGPRLLSVNPFNPGDVQVLLDISATNPGCDLWQPHSSDDGQTHSATVRQIVNDGAYPKIGTVVVKDGRLMFFEAVGVLDESQVSRDGGWVVIKEHGEDNRIVDLASGKERILPDADGAIGHSDCGPDFIVGEDNQVGACVRMDLRTFGRRALFSTWNMGYVSVRAGKCLWSNDIHISLVDLQTGAVTWSMEHGAGVRPKDHGYYDRRPKASMSPCGTVATFMLPDGNVRLLVLP